MNKPTRYPPEFRDRLRNTQRYLKAPPGKDNVQLIVMDLSETYRNIARRYFPNAMIVADRFHVIRRVVHPLSLHRSKARERLFQQYDPGLTLFYCS